MFRYGIWAVLALFALTALSGVAADQWSKLDHLHEAIANITVWSLAVHVVLAVMIYAGRPLWLRLQALTVGATVVLCLALPIAAAQASNGDPATGKTLFFAQHTVNASAPSCTSCHTTDLRQKGQHVKTGRGIDPMAPSVNPERLRDPQKVVERLERDCNNVMGRACTATEQNDLLAFLQAQ